MFLLQTVAYFCDIRLLGNYFFIELWSKYESFKLYENFFLNQSIKSFSSNIL